MSSTFTGENKPSASIGRNSMFTSDRVHHFTSLIAECFRDEQIRKKIREIAGGSVGDDGVKVELDHLIKAAAAWILVEDYGLDYPGEDTKERTSNLYKEIQSLFPDTISDEIGIQKRFNKFHDDFYTLIIDTPEFKKQEKEMELVDNLEGDLIEIMRLHPEYYFFDFIENFLDLASLSSPSTLTGKHAEAGDIERKFSFGRFRQGLISFLRIKNLDDLEVEYLPIKRLVEKIIHHSRERLPISRRGIEAFKRAGELRNRVFDLFTKASEEGTSLETIEEEVNALVLDALKEEARNAPNDLTYYIQGLLHIRFADLIRVMEMHGINNLLLFSRYLAMDRNVLEYKLDEKGLDRDLLEKLNKFGGDLSERVKVSLESYKREKRENGMTAESASNLSVSKLIENHLMDVENPAIPHVSSDLGMEPGELVELLTFELRVKEFCDELQEELGVRSASDLLQLLEVHEFAQQLLREIFLSMLVDLTKQVARIIEFFLLINEIKEDISAWMELAEGEVEWKIVKEQEPLIQQIMQLQGNVAYVLNSKDVYEINAFIHSKLSGITYQEALDDLKEGPSPIYFNIVKHPIALENLGVVSRVSAMDLLFRCQERKS